MRTAGRPRRRVEPPVAVMSPPITPLRTFLSPDRDFRVTEHADDDGCILAITGELDIAYAGVLSAAVGRALDQHGSVSLDLSGLTFLDAAGIGAIARTQRYADASGGRFTLQGASGMPERMLRLCGFGWMLTPEP
jgi:anti-anti-sigma factor